VDCGNEAYKGLVQAVKDGLIEEKQVDESLKRLFGIRIRLGMFDPDEIVPYSAIDSTALEKKEHKDLALKMAQQSVVLLKNDGLLPLKKENLKKIAVVGPNADNVEVQLGNYNGHPSKVITLLEGIREEVGGDIEIFTDTLNGYYGATPPSLAVALQSLTDVDVIIYAGGISPRIEGEEMDVNVPGFYKGDRTSILLPQLQTDVLKKLKATGKPVIFVMMTGSAIAIPWEAANLPAVLNAWYGGEAAGKAIADILFGHYNPSGRLPVTFYAGDKDLPEFEDYDMANRTYKYFKGKALYPFGYGLSYTRFAYEWANAPKQQYGSDESIECSFKVRNEGAADGDEVVQVYIKYPQGKDVRLPLKELRFFQRKNIPQGEAYEVKVSIPVAELAKWDETANGLKVPSGKYTIFAGAHSENEAVSAAFEIK